MRDPKETARIEELCREDKKFREITQIMQEEFGKHYGTSTISYIRKKAGIPSRHTPSRGPGAKPARRAKKGSSSVTMNARLKECSETLQEIILDCLDTNLFSVASKLNTAVKSIKEVIIK